MKKTIIDLRVIRTDAPEFPTAQKRASFAAAILEAIDEGQLDPIDVHYQIKSIESCLSMLTDKKSNPATAKIYSERLLEAAERQGSKQFKRGDATFEIKEQGTKFDFTGCHHPRWNELNDQFQAIAAQLKEIESFLKNVPADGVTITIEDTGEVVTVYPPIKRSTTGVTVTFDKK